MHDADDDADAEEQASLLHAGSAAHADADDARTRLPAALPRSGSLAWARAAACARVAGAPAWAWAQLCVAVLGVSTAATAFLFCRDVPPFLLAGWRLQLVTALLCPAAAAQWRTLSGEERARWRASARKMVLSGTALAFHFGLWVTALHSTSLPHALLFVSVTPVVLAAAALARGVPLSRGELGGTAAALLGAAVLVSDARSDTQARLRACTCVRGVMLVSLVVSDLSCVRVQVTLSGDLCAVGAASVFAIYLNIGGELRAWMPLFLYAVPVRE
jgi:drug/metabolite transporter (DMT)-like permease